MRPPTHPVRPAGVTIPIRPAPRVRMAATAPHNARQAAMAGAVGQVTPGPTTQVGPATIRLALQPGQRIVRVVTIPQSGPQLPQPGPRSLAQTRPHLPQIGPPLAQTGPPLQPSHRTGQTVAVQVVHRVITAPMSPVGSNVNVAPPTTRDNPIQISSEED